MRLSPLFIFYDKFGCFCRRNIIQRWLKFWQCVSLAKFFHSMEKYPVKLPYSLIILRKLHLVLIEIEQTSAPSRGSLLRMSSISSNSIFVIRLKTMSGISFHFEFTFCFQSSRLDRTEWGIFRLVHLPQ